MPASHRLTWLTLLLLWATLSAFEWTAPDVWYHLFLGRRIVETLSPQPTDNLLFQQAGYTNLYWLFQLVCHGVYSLTGRVGLNALFALVWLAIARCWLRLVAPKDAPGLVPPLALVALLGCSVRFEHRPEIFSYLFLMLQLVWLQTWDFTRPLSRRQILLFAGVEALWANVHGYFVLGIFVVGLKLLCERRRSLAMLLGVSLAATVLSPFGPGTWEHVLRYWFTLGGLRDRVQEFLPPTGTFLHVWLFALFWLFWGVTALGALWSLRRLRERLFPILVALPGLYLGATSLRNIPLAFLLAAPLWGKLVEDLAGWRPLVLVDKALAGGTAAVACGLALWAVDGGYYHSLRSESAFGMRVSEAAYPVRFAEYLRRTGFEGRLFNTASDGGYLEYHSPAVRPFADSRFVDAPAVIEYFEALQEPDRFQAFTARYRFDGVLLHLSESAKLAEHLLRDPRWRLAYADLHRVFFLDVSSRRWDERFFTTPVVYQGQDLARRVHAQPALVWLELNARLERPEAIRALLEAFAAAPRIASLLAEFSLRYGLENGREEIVSLATALRPKLVPMARGEERRVDDLQMMIGDI